jgi:hypothetical protein
MEMIPIHQPRYGRTIMVPQPKSKAPSGLSEDLRGGVYAKCGKWTLELDNGPKSANPGDLVYVYDGCNTDFVCIHPGRNANSPNWLCPPKRLREIADRIARKTLQFVTVRNTP